ncbi:hypothetical protein SAMN05216333_11235 [Nitrosomonas oligotropha]|uniref:Uncharacterized protein n=1 Tax=Nitrosomonas oligotropha TaxID=42354 RepID=A0A1H8QLX8_9PROT|nr:hypothetical protein SAMN05216300_11214 [Nitrosomonas oligotropha]SEO55255.1 hypothetical protein SAMN05216333_11235 [Nitrosomonas oligotropha]
MNKPVTKPTFMFDIEQNFVEFTATLPSKSIPVTQFGNSPHQPGCCPASSRRAGRLLLSSALHFALLTWRAGLLVYGQNTVLNRRTSSRMTESSDIAMFCPPVSNNALTLKTAGAIRLCLSRWQAPGQAQPLHVGEYQGIYLTPNALTQRNASRRP